MLSDSTQLVEIVFEQLDSEQAEGLADYFGLAHVSLPSISTGVSDKKIPALALSGVTISNAHLRILHYENQAYDLEVNFTKKDVEAESWKSAQKELHRFAMRVAKEVDAKTFYGGLDPAADLQTRIFTKNEFGPLILT